MNRMTTLIIGLLLATAILPRAVQAQVQWSRSAGGIGHDDAGRVAVDSSGNVYLLGEFSGQASFGTNMLTATGVVHEFGKPLDFYLAKVSSEGNWIWVKQIEADGKAEGLAATPEGEVYVAGRFSGVARVGTQTFESEGTDDDQEDGFVAKFDTDGQLLWSKHLQNTGGFDSENLALDSLGNLLFLGSFAGQLTVDATTLQSQGDTDCLVMKFTPNGVVQWAKGFGGLDADSGKALAVGANGEVWVLGDFIDRITIGTTELVSPNLYWRADFMTKLTPEGEVLWARMQGLRKAEELEEEMATDAIGNCYLVGTFSGIFQIGDNVLESTDGEFETDDVFLARFDADGNVVWVRQFGGTSDDFADALVVRPNGDVIIAGAGGNPDVIERPPQGYLHQLALDGTLISSLTIPVTEVGADLSFLALAQSTEGVLYVAGWIEGEVNIAGRSLISSGERDVLLARLTIEGPPPPLLLAIERIDTTLRLSWNSRFTNYVLEASTDPSLDPSQWSLVPEEPRPEGATNSVLVPIGDENEFFRLALSAPEIVPIANMILIIPGTFTMGSPAIEVDRWSDEGPQMTVTISRGFWMGRYEVTQKEYVDVTGLTNPSYYKPPTYAEDLNRPVENVRWIDAINYCGMLTERERSAGRISSSYKYRLPTEAEWEYACRAGTTTRFSHGDDPGYAELGNFGWYVDNSGSITHSVGQKLPNPWGFYDMHGNVWERCQDWYAGGYPGGVVTDPTGASTGSVRVLRGGCWGDGGGDSRSAYRALDDPTGASACFGFRVVLAPVQ